MNEGKTNIQVSREMRDFLSSKGKKGESYDDILRKLLKTTYDWEKVYQTSIPVKTKNGIRYIDVIIPKTIGSIYISGSEFTDTIGSLCEDNDIEILGEEYAPFSKKY